MTMLVTPRMTLEFKAHEEAVTGIKMKGEDEKQIIYTSSRDKSIRGWRLCRDATGEECARLKRKHLGHSGFVNAIDLCRSTGEVISIGRDEMIRVWPDSPLEQTRKCAHKKIPRALLVHSIQVKEGDKEKTREYIFTGGKEGALNIWNTNLNLKASLLRKDNPKAGITSIKAVPKNPETILCAYEDGAVLAWNIEINEVSKVMKGHNTIINAIAVGSDGSICATAGRDKVVLLWDLKGDNNQCEISLDEPVHCLEFASSAYWLAAGTDNGIAIWDIVEKDIVTEIPNQENSNGICVSLCWLDGFTLVAGYSDGVVRKYTFNIE